MGNLAQQYRCESLEPYPPHLPDGWIEMTLPEIEIYLSGDRVVRITGDSGVANAPKRILESGEIAGHVRISMYDRAELESNSIQATPTMVMSTPQASFDNFAGEITCNGDVRIESPTQNLVGRRLTVRINDLEGRIDYLHLDELDYIDLYPSKSEAITVSPHRKVAKAVSSPRHRVTAQTVKAAAIEAPVGFYIATFSDNVQINQGNATEGKHASGNRMTVAFSEDANSDALVQSTQSIPSIALSNKIEAMLITTIIGTQPLPEESPVRITCDGGLMLVPLEDASLMPTETDETRIELFGSESCPVVLIDHEQQISATGLLFRHEIKQDKTDIFGEPAVMTQAELEIQAPHVWISQQDHVGGAIGQGLMQKITAQKVNTSLTWQDGVDFTFMNAEDGAQGALKKVFCRGEVELISDLNVLTCESLEVNFEKDAEDASVPSLAIAKEDVIATSDSQTLYADEAHVSFKQQDTDSGDALFGNSSADMLFATGDVQVILADGGRAFCNNLNSDIGQEEATLEGDVVIAYQRMLMNQGDKASLTLNRTTGKGKWSGAGQALFLDKPIDVSTPNRIDRPTVNQENPDSHDRKVSMRSKWFESMQLNQKFNNGAGAITLTGDVDVRSQQSDLGLSQMTGENLRLEFEFIDPIETSERQLSKVIAKNDAQIQHRTWKTPEKEDTPLVYYIGGDHVEYVPKTQETLAVGNGEMVVRDPRPAQTSKENSALSGRGTTRFTWSEKLKTTQLSDELYVIHMRGDVEMIHKALDGTVGMLTSHSMEVLAKDSNPTHESENTNSEIALRGLDVQQLKATGSVYIATQSRRVDCDVFDYNLSTGLAKLDAEGQRTIAIVTDGSPYPARAQSVLWNMDPTIDTITIRGASGTGSQ